MVSAENRTPKQKLSAATTAPNAENAEQALAHH
jgi:hypothetical protein